MCMCVRVHLCVCVYVCQTAHDFTFLRLTQFSVTGNCVRVELGEWALGGGGGRVSPLYTFISTHNTYTLTRQIVPDPDQLSIFVSILCAIIMLAPV